MIDVHCHYLPAVDDGARDIQESIALLRLAVKDGVRQIVVTPHVYAGRWDNSLAGLAPKFIAFKRLIASKRIDVELFLGAEVHLLPESLAMVERGEVPFIGGWDGQKALLLELHDARIPPFAVNAVRHLRTLGVVPIIAHPERNKAVMADPDCLEPFIAEGCLMQLTAASLVGRFGPQAERASLKLLERRWAHLVASDAHNLLHRPPMMKAARKFLKKRFGEPLAAALTEQGPARLVEGRAALGLDGDRQEAPARGYAARIWPRLR